MAERKWVQCDGGIRSEGGSMWDRMKETQCKTEKEKGTLESIPLQVN